MSPDSPRRMKLLSTAEYLAKMTPEQRALFESTVAFREEIGPIDFDIVEEQRKLRGAEPVEKETETERMLTKILATIVIYPFLVAGLLGCMALAGLGVRLFCWGAGWGAR